MGRTLEILANHSRVIYAREVVRRCAKVGCGEPAAATAALRYSERILWLRDLLRDRDPNFLDLCRQHADRMTAPVGWRRLDEREARGDGAPSERPARVDAGSAIIPAIA